MLGINSTQISARKTNPGLTQHYFEWDSHGVGPLGLPLVTLRGPCQTSPVKLMKTKACGVSILLRFQQEKQIQGWQTKILNGTPTGLALRGYPKGPPSEVSKIIWIGPWVSRIDCCNGQWCGSIYMVKNSLKTQRNAFFACFWTYVKQPHGHISWATPIPFASINSMNPRINPWHWNG